MNSILNKMPKCISSNCITLKVIIVLISILTISGMYILFNVEKLSDDGNISSQIYVFKDLNKEYTIENTISKVNLFERNLSNNIFVGHRSDTFWVRIPSNLLMEIIIQLFALTIQFLLI